MPQSIKKVVSKNKNTTTRSMRPALTPEADEQQMISLAVDLAKKQLIEGTASSQVITHYLNLASSKKRLEAEIMELQKDLLVAKTESLRSGKKIEELYIKAIEAMKVYSGNSDGEDIDDEKY